MDIRTGGDVAGGIVTGVITNTSGLENRNDREYQRSTVKASTAADPFLGRPRPLANGPILLGQPAARLLLGGVSYRATRSYFALQLAVGLSVASRH